MRVLVFAGLLATGVAQADELYLNCEMGKGKDFQAFTSLIDKEKGTVTHSFDTAQFKAEAFFKLGVLSYKRTLPSGSLIIT